MSLVRFCRLHWLSSLLLAVLCGCSVVPVNTEVKPQSIQPAPVDKPATGLLAFNQQLEYELNSEPLSSLQQRVDVLSIARHLRIKFPQQFFNPLNTAKVAADLKQQLVSGMVEMSQAFQWHYLHSKTFSNGDIAAYYRLDSDDGYTYITLWLEPENYQIYDLHSVSYTFSTLDFVGQFTLLFSQYGSTHPKLSELIKSLQNKQIEASLALYNGLDEQVRRNPALTDFLLRLYSQVSSDNTLQIQNMLVTALTQVGKHSLLFESGFIQQDNFVEAIKIVQSLPLFALQDAKMQSELAILHAYNREYDAAIRHGRQAILAEPNVQEAYFVMLQVSFLARDYALSVDLINVLMAKFALAMEPRVLAEFEESDGFINSGEYQSWLNQQIKS